MLGNYNPDGSQVLDDNLMWTTAAKVAWQVTRSAQLSYFNNLQYKLIGHRGGGTFAESRARNFNDKYPDVHQVKFTSPSATASSTSRITVSAPTTSSARSRKSRPGYLALRCGDQYLGRAADLPGQRDVQGSGADELRLLHGPPRPSGSAISSSTAARSRRTGPRRACARTSRTASRPRSTPTLCRSRSRIRPRRGHRRLFRSGRTSTASSSRTDGRRPESWSSISGCAARRARAVSRPHAAR